VSNLILPSYFLLIEEEDLEYLKRDIWNDSPVPASLKVNNVTYNIDIAYRGSYTRKFPKKSYRIQFIRPSFFSGSREIHLNAEFKDPSLIRNKLSFDFFRDLGVLSPESQHINLTLNDLHQGIYLQLESVNEQFLKKRGLPLGPIYYAVSNNANFSLSRKGKTKQSFLSGYERAVGTPSDDDYIHELIKKINTTPLPDFYHQISTHINIDKYLRWMAGAVCTMNNDGFTHNYALYRNSDTSLFEIIPWDYDATWGRNVGGGEMRYNYVPIGGKKENKLCSLLLDAPESRKLFRNILEEILETNFSVEYLEKKIVSLHQSLRPSVLLDPYKEKAIDKFDGEAEFILQFIRDRNRYLKKRLVYFDL
jgi:spore coat protein H